MVSDVELFTDLSDLAWHLLGSWSAPVSAHVLLLNQGFDLLVLRDRLDVSTLIELVPDVGPESCIRSALALQGFRAASRSTHKFHTETSAFDASVYV